MGDNMRPSSEKELVLLIRNNLGVLGADISWADELKSHGRARTDIALLVDSDLVAVEAKLHDWHRGIAQAALNRIWFDRSYVALWFETITGQVESEARRHGVGLIAIHEEGIVVHRRAPRSRPSRFMRRHVMQNLQEALR